jgi:hypothetical protein
MMMMMMTAIQDTSVSKTTGCGLEEGVWFPVLTRSFTLQPKFLGPYTFKFSLYLQEAVRLLARSEGVKTNGAYSFTTPSSDEFQNACFTVRVLHLSDVILDEGDMDDYLNNNSIINPPTSSRLKTLILWSPVDTRSHRLYHSQLCILGLYVFRIFLGVNGYSFLKQH